MRVKAILALGVACALMLSGCGIRQTGGAAVTPSAAAVQTPAVTEPAVQTDYGDQFTDRDLSADYDESGAAYIRLNGASAASDADTVQIDGGTVTITGEGVYVLSGTLDDGMIVVNAGERDKPQLVLDGASITSATSAPIYVAAADKVIITLAAGSENSLSNGGAFTAVDANNIDGVVFSKADLSFNGTGHLRVVSPAGHGIVCKDDLVITGGTYQIQSAAHGIDANDSVRVTGADLTIVSGKDGIHAENTEDPSLGYVYVADGSFHMVAEGDGISAGSDLQIMGGSFDIQTGGGSANAAQQAAAGWGEFGGHGGLDGDFGGGRPQGGQAPDAAFAGKPVDSRTAADAPAATDTAQTEDVVASIKGLKAGENLRISGGTFVVDAADDAIHAKTSITITGGTFALKSGDDGIHADETLTVTAGTIDIAESYEGLEGLHVMISGGDISLNASDDGLNAAGGIDQSGFGGRRGNESFGGMAASAGGSIAVSGGSLSIHASGDGIDANGTLEISGGMVVVSGPTSGDTAVLDYDTSGVISGGTFIGTGAAQMAQSFNDARQGVIAVSTGTQPAGTPITLTDSAGHVVISHETDQSFAIAILSSPDIVQGDTYTLTIGTVSEPVTAG